MMIIIQALGYEPAAGKRLSGLVSLAALLFAVAAARGQETIFRTPGETGGIAVLDASCNEWRSPRLDIEGSPPALDEMSAAGDDFFTREFGAPASFAFTNGFSRTWGRTPENPWEPAVRICRGWGKSEGRQMHLLLDIEQSEPETAWEWTVWQECKWPKTRKFAVSAEPGKKTLVRIPVGDIRNSVAVGAVGLSCTTTNASVKVSSARLVPVSTLVLWRGTFVLPFAPWKGGVSMARPPAYALRVNGKTVSRGLGIDGQETLRADVTEFLRRGTNTIEVATEYARGWSQPGHLEIETFAVSDSGETFIMDPGGWRVRVGKRQWTAPRFSRSPGGLIGRETIPGGCAVATGVMPLHAGPLQVRHLGPEYPVFDCEDDDIAWRVDLPPRMENVAVAGTVSNMLTGAVVERVAAKGGVARLAVRKTGAYMIHWTLTDGAGSILDRVRTEMMVAGPVEQTFCGFDDFDRVLESRMRLVQSVDCSRPVDDPRLFAEHARHARDMDRGDGWRTRTGREAGLSFRETGEGDGDWFAYKLDVGNLGAAHVIDIDYPDTREQILFAAVKEAYPAGFVNNLPNAPIDWPNASGAVRTGWMAPLSNAKRTMRLVFFPGSRNITVSFEKGAGKRAAVCGFRVYEVPEGLPALKLPETTRLFGNHCERPLCGAWGTAVNGAHYPAWTEYTEGRYASAWLGIANRIRFLRFMGQNLAIEGVYMYKQGFPTASGESRTAMPGFDYAYALAKMYRRNGIRALAGFEYLASPAIMLGGGYDTGEREMRHAKSPLTPAHVVDRHGRQMIGFDGMGLNYLAPPVWESITNTVGEIYRRYAPAKGFEGMFVINNGWWLPGFPAMGGTDERNASYDDLSVSLFERETGIDLGVPFTPGRFAKRYALLTGRYAGEWTAWRARRMRKAMEDIGKICTGGATDWSVYSSPCGRTKAFPGELWKNGERGLRLVPRLDLERNGDLPGGEVSAEALAAIRRHDAVYLTPHGLNERWVESSRLKGWWWRAANATVYDVKASGGAAFHDLVGVCAAYAPQMVVQTWLDVNIPTAHGRESRAFALGFLSTPEGEGRAYPKVRGVKADIYPGGRVRLVNDTPYAVEGTLRASCGGSPLVIRDAFGRCGDGRLDLRLDAFGMTVVDVRDAENTLAGDFRFTNPSANEALWRAAGPFLAHVASQTNVLRKADMRLLCGYGGPGPKRFAGGVPGQGFFPSGRVEGVHSPRRTLSMLVNTEAKESSMLFHAERLFRFDIQSGANGLAGSITAFRAKPGQKGWISIGPRDGEFAAPDKWHHLCFTVDPDGAGMVWLDGRLVAAETLDDWEGLAVDVGAALPASRPDVAPGMKETAFSFARVEYREGVMDWRDIRREASEWLSSAPRCAFR